MNRRVAVLEESVDQVAHDDRAGFGALKTEYGLLPLTALAMEAKVVGLIAEICVCQTFRNAFDQPLEATYIFPLPDRAAVTRFQMFVAGRTIDGELKERGQAREEYDAAIVPGHRVVIQISAAEKGASGVSGTSSEDSCRF